MKTNHENLIYQCVDSSLGKVLVAVNNDLVHAVFLGESNEDLINQLDSAFPGYQLKAGNVDRKIIKNLLDKIESPSGVVDLPLCVNGTRFQEKVWQAIRDIPPGTTFTYTELANCIGVPKAVRAVANACAANKLAIIIPCHRVIRSDGKMSGYRWGLERKQQLLEREAV